MEWFIGVVAVTIAVLVGGHRLWVRTEPEWEKRRMERGRAKMLARMRQSATDAAASKNDPLYWTKRQAARNGHTLAEELRGRPTAAEWENMGGRVPVDSSGMWYWKEKARLKEHGWRSPRERRERHLRIFEWAVFAAVVVGFAVWLLPQFDLVAILGAWWQSLVLLLLAVASVSAGKYFERKLKLGYTPFWVGVWVAAACLVAFVVSLF